jgi:hypothetical protein
MEYFLKVEALAAMFFALKGVVVRVMGLAGFVFGTRRYALGTGFTP